MKIRAARWEGPTAQKIIWVSLRFWWAVEKISHKRWRFRADSDFFKVFI